MEKYKSLYKWMILPMVLMQLGIFRDYWGDFTENAWSVHIHYWTGTIWYIYLIIQPYYATHGMLEKHRTNGIIGMFLAGGVGITAFSMMFRDLNTAQLSMDNPDRFGPFEPWFFYGVASVEIVIIIAFGFAVIKSILTRKSLEDHAWWLITTVFLIMMPALGRGIQNLHIGIMIEDWPNIPIMPSLYVSQAIIIGLIILAAIKYNKPKHPATYFAVAINVFVCFLEPLGKSETVQNLLITFIKG
ncbi:hypothetical protein [Algoriphagus pacificus]|uniref:Uncharacterized protein n=1 Tax=Algoriphagus pacificus TaxID=2811234 RepID=A0ABS3CIX1_9BACT|nr:hypothetical protein [Algoriphagus pacificus]MBN7817053.1 hypothetical protein [Algoriphagus pacificus]